MQNDNDPSLLPKTRLELWLIASTVMLVAIIEVLDMTIVNVALAPMMGALGATQNQITWVLTSYIVSSAIFMVLTGFLVERFGRKRLLIISVTGFLVTSMLCGTATSLPEIVLFRTLQGMFGASLVPLSQTILRTSFPRSEHGRAMAIWGIGIMVAPVLGPTLGGYLTETFNWRWNFYINVPICIVALSMAIKYIKETPTKRIAIDWLGMGLMAVGIGSLQIFLDRGHSADWFQSNFILLMATTSVIFLTTFISRGLKIKNNIINLRLFADRNFGLSCLMLILFCVGALGIISIEPLLLESLLGYPAGTAGIVMAPLGATSTIGMWIVGKYMDRVDPRRFMVVGVITTMAGIYLLSFYNLQTEQWRWMLAGAIQGFGMGMFFVPLSTLSFANLKISDVAEASGLFSFSRNMGISIGISLLSTLITREQQINWHNLSRHIQVYNQNLHAWLAQTGWQLYQPLTLAELQRQIASQSGMIAFIDGFQAAAIALSLLLPLIYMFRIYKKPP